MKAGKIINHLQKSKNMLQVERPIQTGISQAMVGKYEHGDAIPSTEIAKKIADVLEASFD